MSTAFDLSLVKLTLKDKHSLLNPIPKLVLNGPEYFALAKSLNCEILNSQFLNSCFFNCVNNSSSQLAAPGFSWGAASPSYSCKSEVRPFI